MEMARRGTGSLSRMNLKMELLSDKQETAMRL